MNPETTQPSTCCESPVAETEVVTREETATVFSQPEWNARKHDGGIDIEVTLPGVPKDAVEVQVRGRHLELEARRKPVDDRGRLVYGIQPPEAYRLRLRLGDSLDGAKLDARLNEGVLRIAIPLVEAAKPKKIEIR